MRRRTPPPGMLPSWVLAALDAEGLRPFLEQHMGSIEGVQAIRNAIRGVLHDPVARELDGWCERASFHLLELQMQNPIERARLGTQLDRELAQGQISPEQWRQDMQSLHALGGRPDDK